MFDIERFWNKIEVDDNECWNWVGAKNKQYGAFRVSPIKTSRGCKMCRKESVN